MLQHLASYLLGGTTTTSSGTAGGVIEGDNSNRVTLRTTDHDDGWTMVDRDSEGNSDAYSSEEEDNVSDSGLQRVRLERASSNDSLSHANTIDMEESWFVTPPPCFSSQTGPVHIRTSPLENLLIEHPSMSVYQRTGSRHPRLISPAPSNHSEDVEAEELVMDDSVLEVDMEPPMVVYRLSRTTPQRTGTTVHFKEMQVVRHRQAQKVQIKKLAQQTARGHLKRANKAREVNGRNYNPRRKERSQGTNRSHASNNRKC
ncbi:tumor protein p53-inducible nuclear protein 2 [Euwallacea fornicatus]|uniref:tumor protein p53-inducible nuclear protein 2 n=1 Tax=Euwallacea fornicatus TaxID=995702 RepID=UPI00338E5EEC